MNYDAYDSDLVELFEYKVADVLAGKPPKGSQQSLRDLRDYLLNAPLDVALLRHVRQADRAWREFRKAQEPAPTLRSEDVATQQVELVTGDEKFDPLSLLDDLSDLNFTGVFTIDEPDDLTALGHNTPNHSAPSTDTEAKAVVRDEWEILQQLRASLFYYDIHHQARQQAVLWLNNKQMAPLRLALALARALQTAVPKAALPTLAIHYTELQSATQATQTLDNLALYLSFSLRTLSSQYQRIKMVLRSLLGSPLEPNMLETKPLKEEQLDQEQLEHTLKKLLAYGQQDEPMVLSRANQQPLLLQAVQQLVSFLEQVVPHTLGGHGAELALLGGLLYARDQTVRIGRPDDTSLSLAIYLAGGDQAHWRGATLRWRRLGQDGWEIVIANPGDEDDFVRLSAQQPTAETHLAGEKLYLALRGDDLALERRPTEHSDLAPLALEARLSATLLESEQDYVNLRLARAVAMRLRGAEIVSEKVAPESAAVYATTPASTLLAFARQGAQMLLKAIHLTNPSHLSQAFVAGMNATQAAPETAQSLLDLLLTPPARLGLPVLSDYSAPMVSDDFGHVVLPFRDEPLSVRVMNQTITLRNDYKGDLNVIVSGYPTMMVGDMQVLTNTRGGIVIVRLGERIAVGFQPKLPHPDTAHQQPTALILETTSPHNTSAAQDTAPTAPHRTLN